MRELFGCDFCEIVYVEAMKALEHEDKCAFKPENKRCETCGFSPLQN
jgi:hypothetical protein